MVSKCLLLAALLGVARAGYIAAPAVSTAVGSSAQSTLRSLDGGSSVSQYSKAVDTAFSSVRKYDTRITNDARYLAPAVAHTYAAAPAVATYAAAPAVAHTYAAAPAVAAYASPYARVAAPVAHAGLLGVAYSAAPAVAHISFDGLGAHYAW